MPEPDPFDRLPRAERDRLDAFVRRLERTRLEVMLTLAAGPLDRDAHDAARDAAKLAARDARRLEVFGRVREDARDWTIQAYNRSNLDPSWYDVNWGRPGTTEDRARLGTALADAFTALVVWDRLDEADREELLGPFAALLEEPGSRS